MNERIENRWIKYDYGVAIKRVILEWKFYDKSKDSISIQAAANKYDAMEDAKLRLFRDEVHS